MLLWLLEWWKPWLHDVGWYDTAEVVRSITFRGALASVTAFLLTLLLGPRVISLLARHCRERIASASLQLDELSRRQNKHQVPTMGGLFIVAAIVLSVLLWGDLANRYVQIALFVVLAFGVLGSIDDWTKLVGRSRGLSVRQKLAWQLVIAALVVSLLYVHHRSTAEGLLLVVPFASLSFELGIGFLALGLLVMVASSNAVNLTDGLDGLAGGCLLFAGAAFAVLTYLAGHVELAEHLGVPYLAGSGDLSVVMAAMVGAVLGFLWFNCYPAQVFMGDTGSLALGGLIGLAAVVTRQELLLLVVGGVFVAEAASVLLQVGFFKWTRRRLILCAPLHHHFQFKGWHEMKIVVRFWIAAAVLAILAVASLKI